MKVIPTDMSNLDSTYYYRIYFDPNLRQTKYVVDFFFAPTYYQKGFLKFEGAKNWAESFTSMARENAIAEGWKDDLPSLMRYWKKAREIARSKQALLETERYPKEANNKHSKWFVVWDDGIQENVNEFASEQEADHYFSLVKKEAVAQLRDPSYRILKSLRNGSTFQRTLDGKKKVKK